MGKLINRIPGSRLLISSLPGSLCQLAFSKTCLVNLISKDTHLVFSIYGSLLAPFSPNELISFKVHISHYLELSIFNKLSVLLLKKNI